jgi:hypothetical protein
MNLLKKFLIYSLSLSLFTSCATNYNGGTPNFALRGASAEQEIQKFKMAESYWRQNSSGIEMGGHLYKDESLKPLIQDISPIAESKFKEADVVRSYFWIPYTAAILILITQSTIPGRYLDQTSSIAFYGLLGVSIGFSIAAFNMKAGAAEQFNKDLNSRFAPSLSYNFAF